MHIGIKVGLLFLAITLAVPSPLLAAEEAKHGAENAQKGEKGKKETGKAENGAIDIGPLTVNVLSNTGIKFLHLAMTVQCEDNSAAERLLLPDCKQALIFFLSSKLADDLLTSPGKMVLRHDLIELFSKYAGAGKVKNVYFTELVFQ